jgi:hypothetical protein
VEQDSTEGTSFAAIQSNICFGIKKFRALSIVLYSKELHPQVRGDIYSVG